MAFQKLIVCQNDVLPVPSATLTDSVGQPLNIGQSGTTVRFRMVDFITGAVQVDAPAVVLQNNSTQATYGQVAYYWQTGDTARQALYQAWFIVDFGNGTQRFPAEGSYYIRVYPAR